MESLMVGQRYRMKTPTLAILVQGGERVPMTIPSSGIVRVLRQNHFDIHQVDVEWEGKVMLMFAVDLRDRGELV